MVRKALEKKYFFLENVYNKVGLFNDLKKEGDLDTTDGESFYHYSEQITEKFSRNYLLIDYIPLCDIKNEGLYSTFYNLFYEQGRDPYFQDVDVFEEFFKKFLNFILTLCLYEEEIFFEPGNGILMKIDFQNDNSIKKFYDSCVEGLREKEAVYIFLPKLELILFSYGMFVSVLWFKDTQLLEKIANANGLYVRTDKNVSEGR